MSRYENPPLVTHPVADKVLATALTGGQSALEPDGVLVGLALYDGERAYVEQWCRRVAQDSQQPALVATAALCLGHLARRFRTLEPASVQLVERLATRSDLDGRVLSALDDVTTYMGGQSNAES